MSARSSSLGKAAIVLTLIGFLGKGIGFIRELIFARYLGLSEDYEIFLVLSAVMFLLIAGFIYLWQNYLIPRYLQIKTGSTEQAFQFIKDCSGLSLLIAITVVLPLYFFRHWFYTELYSSFAIKTALIDRIIIAVAISLLCNSMIMVLSAWHFAEKKFSLPTILLSFPSITAIIAVVTMYSSFGIDALAFGLCAGYVLQLLVLLIVHPVNIGKVFPLKLNVFSPVSYVFLFTLLIEVVGQMFILVDRYYFRIIHPGGIAALNYAHTLYLLPITIISTALASVLFPSLSAAYAEKDHSRIKELNSKSILVNIYIFLPVTFLFYFRAEALCSLLFEGGKFDHAATLMTAGTLKIFSLSYFFYSLYSSLNRTIYSIGKTKVLFLFTIILLIVKFCLNYLLAPIYDVNGLAISTSVIYVLSFLFAAGYLYLNDIVRIDKKIVLSFVITVAVCSGASYILSLVLSESTLNAGKINLIWQLSVSVAVFGIIYIAGQIFLGGKLFKQFALEFVSLVRPAR